jgi:hypothetical protein
MDAAGMGRLSPQEFGLLYGCCIAFVKLLPLYSIGWRRLLAKPRKYLLQTSFYAQGVVLGGLVFIALVAQSRQVRGGSRKLSSLSCTISRKCTMSRV